jgi:hypothetical protein
MPIDLVQEPVKVLLSDAVVAADDVIVDGCELEDYRSAKDGALKLYLSNLEDWCIADVHVALNGDGSVLVEAWKEDDPAERKQMDIAFAMVTRRPLMFVDLIKDQPDH